MQPFVDKNLPSGFLLQQGIYLQTCAHIELAIWQIIQLADGHDLGRAPDIIHYLKIKRKTRDVLKAARIAVGKIPAPLGLRLATLSQRLGTGLDNRNLAAHGAWFTVPNSDRLHVVHYYPSRPNGIEEWFYVDRTFSQRQIDMAVEDVNLLLLETVTIRDSLRARLAISHPVPLKRPAGFATSFTTLWAAGAGGLHLL